MVSNLSQVSCGFPSPAEDYIETPLDLNELIIQKPSATFFVRAAGDSMIGAGIFDGDLIVIDRSVEVQSGQVVLAVINGEFLLKRFSKTREGIKLLAENPKYKPHEISEGMDFKVWGVATYAIHRLG